MGRQYRPNVQLRNARLLRNWTYKETARELNLLMLSRGETQAAVTLQMIYRWERGEVRPSMFYRHYFCLLYDLRPDELGFLPEEYPQAGKPTAAASSGSPQRRTPLAKEDVQPSPSVTSRQPVTPLSEDDLEALNLTRRHLLAASGLLGAAVGAETATEALGRVAEPIERAARVASGRAAADDALIIDLGTILEGYERMRHGVRADLLVDSVRGHSAMVKSVLDQSLLPEQRMALLANASRTASLLSALLFHQLGNRPAGRRWLVESLQMAEATDNSSIHVLTLIRASGQFFKSGQVVRGIELLEQARKLAERRCSPNALSWVLVSQGEYHATLGQAERVYRLLDLAVDAQQRSRHGYEPSWAAYWEHSSVAGFAGEAHIRLEQPGRARAVLHEALAEMKPAEVNRRSVCLAQLAMTYAQEGEVEQACDLAGKAMDIAGPVRGARLDRMTALRRRLSAWERVPAVKQFDERLRAHIEPAT